MKQHEKSIRTTAEFSVILILGFIVFDVFSHMRPLLDRNMDIAGRILLAAILLILSLTARRNTRFRKYWPVLFAFFISILAISADYYLAPGRWLMSLLQMPLETPAGLALDKLDSSLVIIGLILLMTKISGENMSSLYLAKGSIKKSLLIGIIAFMTAVSGSVFVADLFGAKDLRPEKILPWIPWIMIFVFGNALNEELLFRGLFLRKLEPFLGRFLSNLVMAVPFVLHHTGVTYTNDAILFLAYLLPLSLAWGYITQKTDSLWGSVLFHAGTDIPVVLVIFSGLA